jgi:hypothetical protein
MTMLALQSLQLISSSIVPHTSETDNVRTAGEDAQDADIVLCHGILDGGEEETTQTTNDTSLGSVIEDIVRLECVVGPLVSRQIRARRWVFHGECKCECDCCEKLGAFISWA